MELYPKKNLIKEEHLLALNKMAEVEWEWYMTINWPLPRTPINCQLRFSDFDTTPLLTITYKNGETTHLRFTAERMRYPLSKLTWAKLMHGYEQFLIVGNGSK